MTPHVVRENCQNLVVKILLLFFSFFSLSQSLHISSE